MRKQILNFVMPGVIALAACGGKGSPANPSAPSSTSSSVSSSSQVSAGATISGRVTAGTVTAVAVAGKSAGVDGSGQFSVAGVPAGDLQVQFTGPGNNAQVALSNVTAREDIRLSVRVNGSTVEVDDNRRLTADSRVEVEGRVTAINATARTIQIGDTVINVPTGTPITANSGAAIELSVIVVGDRVEVKGTLNGNAVTASSVKLETERSVTTPPTPPATGATVEVEGVVAPTGRSGNCPALTFMVGTTSITTSTATTYSDGTCASIVAGVSVEVKGTRQSNGSVLATSVEIEDDDDDDDDHGGNSGTGNNEIEVEGRLTGKTGTCPLLTLSIGTASFATNASTQFKDVTCATLSATEKVKIKAVRQPSGLPIASRVEKD